ncbi:hypothetical protein [Virgibacillus sp. JSM 102003]|uniref:hypothetical protein n=1 Tax=Virgibacillus sp. JSM 102003 TaxID=1562108 RepID=UPI0035C2576F
MLSFRGFIQTIGVTLIITLVYGFIIGFFNLMSVEWVVFSTFIVSYGSVGVLAPLWNKQTPYFAAFLSANVLTVLNLLFSVTVLRMQVLVDPNTVNENLLSSTVFAMLIAFLFMQINNRIERENYDKN